MNHLFQEATMPIEEVIAKYGADQVANSFNAVVKLFSETITGI